MLSRHLTRHQSFNEMIDELKSYIVKSKITQSIQHSELLLNKRFNLTSTDITDAIVDCCDVAVDDHH